MTDLIGSTKKAAAIRIAMIPSDIVFSYIGLKRIDPDSRIFFSTSRFKMYMKK